MQIGAKAFLSALIILFALMVLAYVMTFVLPSGEYQRSGSTWEVYIDADGQERINSSGSEQIVAGSYTQVEGGISFWKWLLSPVLVLGAEGGATVGFIALFLIIVGGAFNALDGSGVMRYVLSCLHHRFRDRKYTLLAVVVLFFMCMGAIVGSYEDMVPLVPLCVALAYCLGWDALVGMGMCLLAVGCGFATGLCNPYTIGIAQKLAGLPMFSGIGMRLLSFVILYPLLLLFLSRYAKKIEKNPEKSLVYDPAQTARWCALREDFAYDKRRSRGMWWYATCTAAGMSVVICSAFVPALWDATMPLSALTFLIAGVGAALLGGLRGRECLRYFGKGVVQVLPAVLLILMAGSIRYTMQEAKILDTVLYYAVNLIQGISPGVVVLCIYALVLVLEVFIASGSAKAFLLMPLIASLSDLVGVSRQLSVLAYAYGDGFSNMIYPTNPVVLISLGLIGVSYGKWAKWTIGFQILILAITCGLLLLGSYIGY